jgi:glycosyltransferase involved in cell wall biosynthesis
LNLSVEGITSFSIAPLRAATYMGLITATIAVIYGLYMMGRTILFGNPVAGYPSLLVIILFLGGVQLLSLGIIGEYVGRIFNETKERPLYLVDSVLQGKASTQGDSLNVSDCAEVPSAAARHAMAAVRE